MEKYQNIKQLIEDVEDILDSIFVSGLYSARKDVIDRAGNIAAECRKYGLTFASAILVKVADGLETRRHSLEYDYGALVKDYCVLGTYINIFKNKLDLKLIEGAMRKMEGR